MGELKSCLFCGKRVEKSFEYCPHCGYEFGEGDELAFGGDSNGALLERYPELPGLIPEAVAAAAAPCPEPSGACHPEEDEGYLRRLHTLQEILADMERELDTMIRSAAKGS